ncbi:MAG TPA: hypothetical protein VGG06_14560 [Thermoanaerobaculia bacterium]|jgi:hypothetical protein
MSTMTLSSLEGLPVFLSASLPQALSGTPRALDLQGFLVAFVRGLLAAGGRLVFGGHPAVTPLVQRVASDFGEGKVDLYQLTRFRDYAPAEVRAPQFVVHWVDSDSLEPMRDRMVDEAQAAVFVGGKTRDEAPIGGAPGICDEYRRFLRRHPGGPAYVLGLLGGEAERLARELENNGGEPNGLNAKERRVLHHTTDVDLAASLVLADLRRLARKSVEDLFEAG